MNYRLLTCAFISIACIPSASADSQNLLYQVPQDFSRPLTYSRESISHFLKNVFNHPQYGQDFLALNFAHITQIMSLAPKHSHPRRFIRKGLGLFSLKLQDIRYINSYAFHGFIQDLISCTAGHTSTEIDKNNLIDAFKRTIGSYIVDKFELLKEEPDQALTELSMRLYALVEPYEKQDISVRELQHAVHYFLSQALNLLVWSPENQHDTWYCMLAIADRLEQCALNNIIDKDMLDDLYWILLHRYTYFLSLAGPELSPEFFDLASSALQDMKNAFWFSSERELFITTKYEFLQKALIQEDAASRLIAAGYVQ